MAIQQLWLRLAFVDIAANYGSDLSGVRDEEHLRSTQYGAHALSGRSHCPYTSSSTGLQPSSKWRLQTGRFVWRRDRRRNVADLYRRPDQMGRELLYRQSR